MWKKYSLVGIDGNAYAIMGYVSKCMRKEGYNQTRIDKYCNDAMSGDYNHLLQVSIKMIDELNKLAR